MAPNLWRKAMKKRDLRTKMEAVYSGEFSQILEVLKWGPLLFLGGPL